MEKVGSFHQKGLDYLPYLPYLSTRIGASPHHWVLQHHSISRWLWLHRDRLAVLQYFTLILFSSMSILNHEVDILCFMFLHFFTWTILYREGLVASAEKEIFLMFWKHAFLYPLGSGHNQIGYLKGGGLTLKQNTYSAIKYIPLEQW